MVVSRRKEPRQDPRGMLEVGGVGLLIHTHWLPQSVGGWGCMVPVGRSSDSTL